MTLLSAVWYAFLALLGLSIRPDAPPTEGTNGDICRGLKVTNGFTKCDKVGSQIYCYVVCDGKPHGDFSCTKGKGWTPELPTCAKPIEDGCRGLKVTNGFTNCDKVGSQIYCNVVCDGIIHGDFTCTKGKGWTPELPTCAKPIEGSDNGIEEALKAESGDCPNTRVCTEFCLSQGRETGRCIGIYKSICACS